VTQRARVPEGQPKLEVPRSRGCREPAERRVQLNDPVQDDWTALTVAVARANLHAAGVDIVALILKADPAAGFTLSHKRMHVSFAQRDVPSRERRGCLSAAGQLPCQAVFRVRHRGGACCGQASLLRSFASRQRGCTALDCADEHKPADPGRGWHSTVEEHFMKVPMPLTQSTAFMWPAVRREAQHPARIAAE
jgi:hypothetical protein